MQRATAFTEKELVFVMVNSIITKLYLLYPETVVSYGRSASFLLTLLIIGIGYLFIFAIAMLYQKFTLNRFIKIIISLTLVCINGLFLRSVSESINITLLPNLGVNLISLFFLIGVCIAVLSGLKAIVRSHSVIVPITLGVTGLLFLFNLKYFNLNNMYPIFADGTSSFTPAIVLSSYFTDFFLVLLLAPYKAKQVNMKSVILKGFGISSIALIAIISCVLFTLNEQTIIPVYKLAQNISVGEYTPRLEVIYSFVWFLSFYLNFSLMLYLSCKLFCNGKTNKNTIIPLAFLSFAVSIIPKNILQLENSLKVLMYVKIIVFYCLPIIILLLRRSRKA